MTKELSLDEARAFSWSKTCQKCNTKVVYQKGDWVLYYECPNCGQKYEYQASDMGQTLPYLAEVDSIPEEDVL